MGSFTQGLHIPAPLAFLAICAEFLGSMGLILGFLDRAAAFGIACNMMVAVAMAIGTTAFLQTGSATKRAKALSTTFSRSPSPWSS